MKNNPRIPSSVDDYIDSCHPDVQATLRMIRQTIAAAAPEAKEKISYGMPAYAQKGTLVYFAAWKSHIGFYPTSSGIKAFGKELESFVKSKGAVQFPLDKPVPYDLISEIVRFRVNENLAKAAAKRKTKSS
ncbi:MAG: DUF1801 domain-containing protein [Pyrinomonadaceae bacterium]